MSLQSKIIAWFVVFASLTIILIGVGDYYQATFGLRNMFETQGRALAGRMAGEVERAYERTERELLAIGYSVAGASGSTRPETPNRYTRLRVIRGDSVLLNHRGAPSTGIARCAAGDVDFAVALPSSGGGEVRVEAILPVDRFFADVPTASSRLGERGLVTVMHADGRLVFDAGCSLSRDANPAALRAALAAGVRKFTPADPDEPSAVELRDLSDQLKDNRIVALARSEHPAWVSAVTVDYAPFAVAFAGVLAKYLAVLVIVLVGAMAIVLRGLRKDMARLSSIADAADAIGHGRFDVWLPPPTSDEVGHVSLALGRMVERIRATMQQIEVARSMAVVGELATYLSHEVRNPLSSIRLNLQMLRRDLGTDTVPEDAQELVGFCLTELQRLDEVVSTVLKVGRPPHRNAERVCDADGIVSETIGVMQGKLRDSGITVSTRLDAAESTVAMDGATLHGVLMNLLLNGMDAVRERPRKEIEIGTELEYFDDTDRRLVLRVKDSGPGVDPELRGRIFEPFFTTKRTGNGIGLSTALRAAQDSGGTLYCSSRSDWKPGAEFVLELPVAGSPAVGLAEAHAASLVSAGVA